MKRDEIINSLFETMDVAKRSMHGHMQSVTYGSNISRTQLELLFSIRHLQPVSSKDLAAHLRLTPGAVSQLLEGLDEQALVERQIDPADRRRQVLHVSSKGKALLTDVEGRRRTIMEHVMQGMTDEELQVWLRIQQRLIEEFSSTQQQKKGSSNV